MCVFVTCLGFRGSNEHTDVLVDQVYESKYLAGRPLYEGTYGYIRVKGMTDKSCILGPFNGTCCDTEKFFFRLPIKDISDMNDPGAIIF